MLALFRRANHARQAKPASPVDLSGRASRGHLLDPRQPVNTAGPVLQHRPSENTTQPSALTKRLDNGMSHGTPLARKGNPTWSFSSAPEPLTPWRNDLLGPAAAAEVFGWLADIPRRIGARLFLEADEEAYWRGWQVTASRSGLSRT